MAYEGLMDDVRKCVALRKPSQVPVFADSEEFDVRMYGERHGITYEEYCRNAETMAACQIESVERYDYDWAWLQVDDCIEFEVLGVGTRGEGNILRATCDYLPATFETLKKLKMPDPQTSGRMPVLLDALRRVKEHFGDKVCVTGRTAAPFSSVGLLYGMQECMMMPYTNKELLEETLEFFVELQTSFGIAQIKAGADAIWFGDCNASSHLISPETYEQFAAGAAGKVSDAYKEAGGLVFYHASEDGKSLPVMAELGFSALTSGPEMDITDALKVTAGKVCYIGNIDPIRVIQNGSPEEVEAETRKIVEEGKKVAGYMFCSGEMVPRETPEENIVTMVRTVRRYGKF